MKSWKRVLAALLAAMMLAGLTACKRSEQELQSGKTETADPAPASEEAPPEGPAAGPVQDMVREQTQAEGMSFA